MDVRGKGTVTRSSRGSCHPVGDDKNSGRAKEWPEGRIHLTQVGGLISCRNGSSRAVQAQNAGSPGLSRRTEASVPTGTGAKWIPHWPETFPSSYHALGCRWILGKDAVAVSA
jgi:hypothetical protein